MTFETNTFPHCEATGLQACECGRERSHENERTHGNEHPREIVCVKWGDPADELVGIARLARQLVASKSVDPGRVRLVAPTAAWGMQLERACESVGLASAFCMPHARLSSSAQESLDRLQACARAIESQSPQANSPSPTEHSEFAGRYAKTTGFTLVRACGLAANGEFHCALRHVRGDEDARELLELVKKQLLNPTLPPETGAVRIDHFQCSAAPADFVFIAGCADELLPETVAMGSANATTATKETGLAHFQKQVNSAEIRATVSWFTRIEASLATRARIKFSRIKQEEGKSVALCRPAPLLRQWGAARHGTIGGQTLLRQNGLN